ncbi:hypothetical protein F7647_03375 [Tenacibaculum piscium]|uniref:hypothetical protein n=1 Tax=Tenacibaculum piscium TaxID=1458515 RepID=UPI00187B36D2|nr:hypothetical protein [Tenacibaculum piscium]MBE7685101.1 hypothetical protein [Tenacibaculum piscium]
MKALKITLLFVIMVFSNTLFAQKNLFETLEANGEDAIYTVYDGISRNTEKEKGYHLGGRKSAEKVHLKIFRTSSGVPMGVHVRKVSDNQRIAHATTEYDSTKMDHYPLVLMISKPRESFLAIDNMAFFIRYFNYKDGSYEKINTIYILDESNKETKKKKKGGFFNKLKKTVKNKYTKAGLTDDNQKMFMAINLDDKIRKHWKAMRALQIKYKKTTKDLKDLEEIQNFRVNKYKKIDAKNEAYEKMAAAYRAKHGNGGDGMVELYNSSSNEVLIIDGNNDQGGTKISGKSSRKWNCKKDGYIGIRTKNGSNTSSKTIRKIYSANSKCKGKVSF